MKYKYFVSYYGKGPSGLPKVGRLEIELDHIITCIEQIVAIEAWLLKDMGTAVVVTNYILLREVKPEDKT